MSALHYVLVRLGWFDSRINVTNASVSLIFFNLFVLTIITCLRNDTVSIDTKQSRSQFYSRFLIKFRRNQIAPKLSTQSDFSVLKHCIFKSVLFQSSARRSSPATNPTRRKVGHPIRPAQTTLQKIAFCVF
jgi:hypothetical protein